MSLKFCFVLLLGNHVIEEQLNEVAKDSEVINIPNNFLDSDFRERCIKIVPYTERTENDEWYYAYIYLKENFV